MSLEIHSEDNTAVGPYLLKSTVFYVDFPTVSASVKWTVNIRGCKLADLDMTPSIWVNKYYAISSPA